MKRYHVTTTRSVLVAAVKKIPGKWKRSSLNKSFFALDYHVPPWEMSHHVSSPNENLHEDAEAIPNEELEGEAELILNKIRVIACAK